MSKNGAKNSEMKKIQKIQCEKNEKYFFTKSLDFELFTFTFKGEYAYIYL